MESHLPIKSFETLQLLKTWKEWFRSVFIGAGKPPEQESSSYFENTVTLEEAKQLIPNDCVFFAHNATGEFAQSSTPHQEVRDQVLCKTLQRIAAQKNIVITDEQSNDWITGFIDRKLRSALGVTDKQLEFLVYKELVEKYPNILWMRGGNFGNERELYGSVGESNLAISDVLTDAFGDKRTQPVLYIALLSDILEAQENKIITARRGMAHIGSELVIDLPVTSEEVVLEYKTWLKSHIIQIRPSSEKDFITSAIQLFREKSIKDSLQI